jgi:O-antigen ligase
VVTLGIYLSPLHDELMGSNATSVSERQTMWANTAPAAVDFMPVGSGIGSFPALYASFENPSEVTTIYTSHAHNDYLEIALETGLPGVLLVIAFLFWWGSRTWSIWRSPQIDVYAAAGTVASAALLLHSFVDYPLRTAGLSAIMAACLALMAHSRDRSGPPNLWPTRHLTV